MAQLASGALAAVGADYAGVDLIRTRRRAAAGAGGEQQSLLARTAERVRRRYRRSHRRGLPDRRRRAPEARVHAAFRNMPGLSARQTRDCSSPPAAPSSHALKPGNVHVHAGGHGMEAEQFEASAVAAAPFLAAAGATVGARILRARRSVASLPQAATPTSASCCCARRWPPRSKRRFKARPARPASASCSTASTMKTRPRSLPPSAWPTPAA